MATWSPFDARRRTAWLTAAMLLLVLPVALGPGSSGLSTGLGTARAAAPQCGTATTAPPAVFGHVVWIVMENKEYSSVIGKPTDAPFINELAATCGLATNYLTGVRNDIPSLPHYIAMTSGDTQGVVDNKGPKVHPLSAPSIFSQLSGSGDWRALQQSMPANCKRTNAPPYAVRHNPAAYYTNISTECLARDVPLGATPDLAAAFTFITPDLEHDMHRTAAHSTVSSQVQAGDAWLAGELPLLTATPQYQSGDTAIFLTWDEATAKTDHIPTLVVSPYTAPGTAVATVFTHYSLLRTAEELLGLPLLGHAADDTTASMRAAFGLTAPAPSPTPTP